MKFEEYLSPSGPVALTIREYLEPVHGKDSVLFPPTFAPPEGSKDKPSYVIDTTACLIDSVGSQANRSEVLFKQERYSSLVPQVTVRVGERSINLLDAGHRAADAIIRFSDQADSLRQAFMAIRDRGHSTELARISPTSLIYGVWDSRDTRVKLPRMIGSVIRAYGVEKLDRAATFFTALEEEEIADVEDAVPGQKLSEIGLDNAPVARGPGGVIARAGVIREATLNLIVLLTGETWPHIAYTWRTSEPDPALMEGLRHAVNSLHTFGWGVDMAFAELTVGEGDACREGYVRWRPSDAGKVPLQVPTEGSLTDLQETHRRALASVGDTGVDSDTRPSVYREQLYSNGVSRRPSVVMDLRQPDSDKFISLPVWNGMVVAAWLRHAVQAPLQCYPKAMVDAVAMGHPSAGQPEWRLLYLPLPSIGHQKADGRIRRVMITGPAGLADELVEVLRRGLHGAALTDDDGKEVCRLAESDGYGLARFYSGIGKVWETVTPLILHGHNAKRGQISNRKTERLMLQAFEDAGLDIDEMETVTFQPAPNWPNTGAARSFRVPAHLNNWPRYHVSIQYRKAVSGPMAAGLGRHYGLGVFASPDAVKRGV